MAQTRAPFRFSLLLATLLVCLAASLPAAAVTGYVIYTKDGHRIEARDKPTVSGKRLLFLTKTGSPQSIALEEFDEVGTEKANRAGLGGAYVLDTPDQKVLPAPAARTPSLSEYIKIHKKNEMDPDSDAGKATEAAREKGGLVKLAPPGKVALPEPPATLDPQTNDVFSRAFEQAGLRGARVTPTTSGVRVQAVTETEQQIFLALAATARGLKESRAYGRTVDKVDLWLVTSNGDSAGHFQIAAEDANALLNNRITPAKFFVTNVIF
jgi:hypothetical protein